MLLKQRHDELPKLVATCKESMQHEQDTLRKVVEVRSMVAACFDSDGDGQINLQEWNHARVAAEDQVDRERIERPYDSLLVRSPESGRPYLLSNQDPKDLATRYKRWSWLHAIVFAGTSVATLVYRFS